MGGDQIVAALCGDEAEQELRDAGAAHVFRSIDELRESLGSTPLARA